MLKNALTVLNVLKGSVDFNQSCKDISVGGTKIL